MRVKVWRVEGGEIWCADEVREKGRGRKGERLGRSGKEPVLRDEGRQMRYEGGEFRHKGGEGGMCGEGEGGEG